MLASWKVLAGLVAATIVATGCASAVTGPPPTRSATETAAPSRSIAVPSATTGSPATSPLPTSSARWIVYAGNTLTKARADGTALTPLFGADGPPSPAHGDWSPDGKRIAFQAGVDGSWDIWIANGDGTDARVLVDCVTPCINLDAPAWSPNGQEIAFSRLDQIGDALPSMLQTVNVATGYVTTIAALKSGDYVTAPRWSPDGRSLVVALEDHHGPAGTLVENPVSSAIAIVNLDAARRSLNVVSPHGLNASYPDWSPTDDRIVFEAGEQIWWEAIADSRSNLYVMRSDGSDLQQVTHFSSTDPAIWMPAWSGDGSSILATRTVRATKSNDLVRISLDGRLLPLGIGGAHAREQRVISQ